MGKRNSVVIAAAAAMGMGLLILDAKTAISGAREGLELCIATVIPSLFPFFLLSNLITNNLLGKKIPLLEPLRQACGISEGAESLLLIGFLGGYPVGAQSVSQACHDGQLSRDDAERMLGFCSNAGPAFLFGMVAYAFEFRWTPWLLWLIHIVSALLVGMVLPGKSSCSAKIRPAEPIPLSQTMNTALRAMASVCGWVILFRVVIAIAERWLFWLLPAQVQVTLYGLLELSNGCCAVYRLENTGLRFIVAAMILGFGGLCVTMQTLSVTGYYGLRGRYYFPGKVMQCLISGFLAAMAQQFLLPAEIRFHIPVAAMFIGAVFLILLILFPPGSKKAVAFSRRIMYNQSRSN